MTERKEGRDARARLAAIVESSDDAIIAIDLDGVIASWNQGAERLYGYTAQEAVGQPVTMLIPPERLAKRKAFWSACGAASISSTRPLRLRKDEARSLFR